MASIIGKGILKQYSQTVEIHGSVPASSIPDLMKLPENYRENVIAVRDGKVLSLDDPVNDDDEIILFISVMGG